MVEQVNERYLAPLRGEAIAGKVIPRKEAGTVLDVLTSSQGRRGVLLSGEAGVGKSGVMLQVIDHLLTEGIPALALRIDRLAPEATSDAVGRQLGLLGSPPNVLAAIARDRDCVLVIDQLDAVSLASGRNPQFFESVHEMVRQAERHPQMRVLMACRKFDLENDHRLRRLTGQHGVADEIRVERLPRDVVGKVCQNLGLNLSQLNDRQWDLLSLPLHLSILADTAVHVGRTSLQFETAKELYDLFWSRKQDAIRARLGHPPEHWVDVVDVLCAYMSDNQVLSAPVEILDAYSSDARAMTSEHILVQDGRRCAFFHESFFDYAFARRFVARGENLLALLRAGEQHLFRRAQVRQILVHERDADRQRYLDDVRMLLSSPDIRFHIKQVFFAVLRQLQDPTED